MMALAAGDTPGVGLDVSSIDYPVQQIGDALLADLAVGQALREVGLCFEEASEFCL
ncbi:hypothetical protein [uncultured Roseobacter sp.]|uniref:hypothetical protein n=1 Tax=uncultured Roseobacter sp. TaxID=114847 RepID=UPI0026293D6E|nr:hypothetical protein [uncultured Roseobacter sp.]